MGAPENFLCAVFCDSKGLHKFTNREDARKFIFNKRKKTTLMFAHNLAYDINNIDYPEGTISLMPLKSRLIGGKWNYGKNQILRFMDTGNFFVGASIDQLGKTLGYKKLGCSCHLFNANIKTGLCLTCGMFDIRLLKRETIDTLPPELVKNMLDYCGRDAEICYKIAMKLFELSKHFNTRLKSFTASSMALRIFRTNFLNNEWTCRSMEINDYERLAYYGGRTEAYDYRQHQTILHEDISSSYPTQMRNQIYPHPSNYFITTDTWNNVKKYEGVSLVKIEVPMMHIPPLPYRREDGKLIFPYGTWIAAYTHPELKMAEKYGVKIIKCYQSILYNETFNPFKEYINTFYNLKNISAGIDRDFYKLMLNGLSGKLGEKTYRTIRGRVDTLELCECKNKHVNPHSKFCSNCGQLDFESITNIEPEFNITTHELEWINIIGARENDSKHTFPVLIAYITAYGRIQLYEHRLKYQDILYTDTDSSMSVVEHNDYIGTTLGMWSRDNMYNFKAHAPKFYTYQRTPELCKCSTPNMNELTGICNICNNEVARELKLKGVPKKHIVIWECDICSTKHKTPYCKNCDMQLDIKQKRYIFQRPMKLSEAIRRHIKPNKWITITKQISMSDNKRIRHPDGTSEPLYINDIREITTFKDMLKFYETDTLGI
jgi:hypothetical protein